MFHKASTEAERQKIFDDYILSILKTKTSRQEKQEDYRRTRVQL